ncbi:Voltage-gated hydrogen channel 1 [Mactra antiquata]
MGMYTQSNGVNASPDGNNTNSTGYLNALDRRRSVGFLSVEERLSGDGAPNFDAGRDSIIEADDIATIIKKKEREKSIAYRFRKRLNILLHTHIALISVCVLSSLDAVCVIGQVICDILIMSDKLDAFDKLHYKTIDLLVEVLPGYYNNTDYKSWSFEEFINHLETIHNGGQLIGSHGHTLTSNNSGGISLLQSVIMQPQVLQSRASGPQARAGGGGEHDDHLLYELTHVFHIGSMAILSILLVESFLKIFAMGRQFLHHKLEIFDAFVVTVSWCLDVAFWEGIWARPGQEGATLLIFILPWRVIRIVNSFVLVIQEKDLVLLKVAKQRLRLLQKKEKDSSSKLDKYRLEVKQLQGLCRKQGAEESAIQACCPQGRRRRSSLFQSFSSLAAVALVSALGSEGKPHIESDDENDSATEKVVGRLDSTGSGSGVKWTIGKDDDDECCSLEGQVNKMFTIDGELEVKSEQRKQEHVEYNNTAEQLARVRA